MITIHLAAPNNKNGNPRRLYLVIDPADGNVLDVIDEGYKGIGALREAYPEAVLPLTINVTAKEYKAWLKVGESR